MKTKFDIRNSEFADCDFVSATNNPRNPSLSTVARSIAKQAAGKLLTCFHVRCKLIMARLYFHSHKEILQNSPKFDPNAPLALVFSLDVMMNRRKRKA